MTNMRENLPPTPSIFDIETMGIDMMDRASRRSHKRQLDATYKLRVAMKEVFDGVPDLKIEFGNEAVIPDPYMPVEPEAHEEPDKIKGASEQVGKIKITLPNGTEIYFSQVNKYEQNPEQVARLARLSTLDERRALLEKEGSYQMIPQGGSLDPNRESIRKWYELAQELPSGTVLNIGSSYSDPNPRIAFIGEPKTISCAKQNLKTVLEILKSKHLETEAEDSTFSPQSSPEIIVLTIKDPDV